MAFIDPKFEIVDADETARLRRIIKMQLAVIGSLVLHVVVLVILAMVPLVRDAALLAELAKAEAYTPPVPITFTSPQPSVRQQPRPSNEPEFRQETPPPDAIVDPNSAYRMDPTRKLLAAKPPERETTKANGVPGRQDSRPRGGEAGGELSRLAAGAPRGAPMTGETADGAFRDSFPDTPDLKGRLRDFRRAMAQPRPPSPGGPEGGGPGKGGVEIPALPTTGFGVGNLEFESADFDWSDYGKAIYFAIWRAWHNRLWMTVGNFERWAAVRSDWGLEHTSGVRFTITRSGQIVDVAVETESGCIPLDDSAFEALREVVLPPLPDDFPRGQEKVHARFIATGDVRNMRKTMDWLKQHGLF